MNFPSSIYPLKYLYDPILLADMTIKQLRKTMREMRQQLCEQTQAAAARDLATQLSAKLPAHVKHVALYLANDGEVCPTPFIEQLWQRNVAVYLPVLHPFNAGNLLFLRYQQHTKMVINKYGISEPALDVRLVCPPAQLDIIYTPLVAFDKCGNRMGMGGGYYDRTLAHLPDIMTIGLAHDCQQVDKLDVQPWDMPLDYIITPSQQIKAQ